MPRDDRHRRSIAGRVLWHGVLAGAALAMSFPVLWALITSFKPPGEVFSAAPFPVAPTIDNYAGVVANWPAMTLVVNTVVMSAGVALGQLVIATLAAFALVYVTPRVRPAIQLAAAVALVIPPQAIVIPQFLLATRLGWQNTDVGLIVPQLGASALAVLLLVQHVGAIPTSLCEAARLEGARPWETLWHVVLPNLRPAIAAVGILVFISTWNEYLWPLLMAPRAEDATVQIGLSQFDTEGGIDYGALMAAATLTSLPIAIVYAIASRRITDSFLQSGLK
ncbi:carbohydrate ABC transporter permease [Agromyces badenianii]|uniref:carbohydrate ABC transporter permease n=1 Tax=Agromyces badenianii TaxID=2080742 RepID=UPI000D59493B|nr:carbohydrate ABC transporter permease [Agromyces badenianii]PWC03538.1 carbohydrate ABC transporter permease [Agromyces badenianii]